MKDCKDCKFKKSGDNQKPDTISWYEHQEEVALLERIIKRIIIAFTTLFLVCAGIVAFVWLSYDYTSETEEHVYTYQQDGSGVNVVGNGNEVQNGAESNDR